MQQHSTRMTCVLGFSAPPRPSQPSCTTSSVDTPFVFCTLRVFVCFHTHNRMLLRHGCLCDYLPCRPSARQTLFAPPRRISVGRKRRRKHRPRRIIRAKDNAKVGWHRSPWKPSSLRAATEVSVRRRHKEKGRIFRADAGAHDFGSVFGTSATEDRRK